MKNKRMLAICLSLATAAFPATSVFAKGQLEPKDDKGGKGHPIFARRGQPEPKDDRGGKGNPIVARRGQPEPGDDRGVHPQPGDD